VVHFTIDGSPVAAHRDRQCAGRVVVHAERLADGPHTIVASQTDTFGNTGTASLSLHAGTTTAPAEALAITAIAATMEARLR